MKEYRIPQNDAGMRLDKFCARVLKNAPYSFIFKMLRKKNITLNGKKAKGNELLQPEDLVVFYLSDETIASFGRETADALSWENDPYEPEVVFENEQLLIVNKPDGMLSQKAGANDRSMNEYCIRYLTKNGSYNPSDPAAFKPAVCNRLDRNTSGLMLIAKTHAAASMLAKALRDRSMDKYYACIVKGTIREAFVLNGYLKKDESTNTVTIVPDATGADRIETAFEPLSDQNGLTLLNVKLVTGKSHQIRAHLASIGHPILGDPKYGDSRFNREYGCKHQLLHAYRIKMPVLTDALSDLSGREFEISFPKEFSKYMRI